MTLGAFIAGVIVGACLIFALYELGVDRARQREYDKVEAERDMWREKAMQWAYAAPVVKEDS